MILETKKKRIIKIMLYQIFFILLSINLSKIHAIPTNSESKIYEKCRGPVSELFEFTFQIDLRMTISVTLIFYSLNVFFLTIFIEMTGSMAMLVASNI